MTFHLAPIRQQEGQWRVNWLALVGWVLLLNSIIIGLVYAYSRPVPSRQLRHPAAVSVDEVTLRSVPADEMHSSTVEVLALGDTVDVLAIQADGWCKATLRQPPLPSGRGGIGFIQKKYLTLADSTVAALQK
jgi:hypothetical protein